MSNYPMIPAGESSAALNMLTLAGYATLADARADACIFVCVECGSTMYATTDTEHSRVQQQAALWKDYAMDCCGEGSTFAV